ncbi:MAG: ATP-binding protein [Candidatus Tumulicola sp.]
MDDILGRVINVTGSQIEVALEADQVSEAPIRIGDLVKVGNGAARAVVGTIAAVQTNGASSSNGRIFVVDLLGEIVPGSGNRLEFSRGVSLHPGPGEPVFTAGDADLNAIYDEPSRFNVKIGALHHDAARPALLLTDELLTKHFAVLGTTGSGKSCSISLILSAILDKHRNAHIVLFDPHNEYAAAFGDRAELITVDNLNLPLWMLNLEEAVNVLVRGGSAREQESQAIILKDAITWARRHYADPYNVTASITVDTPVPFHVHELLRFINEEMGRLAKPDTSIPYLRLRTRIESLRDDRRFSFLFSSEEDTLAEIVGRLLRMPVDGKPLTIVDLSGVPSDVADVVVSVLCRVIFDFSIWSERDRMPPVLLVCEEAHRYIPADERVGFAETARIITRIAREGRKYGISLALISQRPSELSPPALSQCGTVFSLRLGSELDQDFIARTLPDVARGMLTALPSLPTQQAIVSGEGVRVPMRIRFDDLPADRRPHSEGAEFSKAWQTDSADREFLDDGIRRWRAQIKSDVRAPF